MAYGISLCIASFRHHIYVNHEGFRRVHSSYTPCFPSSHSTLQQGATEMNQAPVSTKIGVRPGARIGVRPGARIGVRPGALAI